MPGQLLTSSEFKGTLVKEGEFQEVSLSDYKGKWVVLASYPLDFSKYCLSALYWGLGRRGGVRWRRKALGWRSRGVWKWRAVFG